MVSVSTVINNIKAALPSTGKILTKGAGIAGLGIIAYDAHHIGKVQSDLYASERDASTVGYYLNNTLYNSSMSKFSMKIKEWSYKHALDHTWRRFFNEGIGYVKGFGSMLVDNVVPLLLSIGALAGKGKVAKGSAIGLAVYGGYEFLKNYLGWGTPPGLNKFE